MLVSSGPLLIGTILSSRGVMVPRQMPRRRYDRYRDEHHLASPITAPRLQHLQQRDILDRRVHAEIAFAARITASLSVDLYACRSLAACVTPEGSVQCSFGDTRRIA